MSSEACLLQVDKTLDTIVDLERVAIRTRPSKCSVVSMLLLSHSLTDKVNSFIINIHIPLNYPLDFYYLMDFSCSMANDLETIQGLSTDISKYVMAPTVTVVTITVGTLKNLTTDFRVGFGAFSDKEALPFTFERKYVINIVCTIDVIAFIGNRHFVFLVRTGLFR